jgi:hypothetical protein
VPWTRIGDLEARLEAHLDALVVGESLALEVCRSRLKDGDAGELFAALCVACRRREAETLNDVWCTLDPADSAKVRAVTDALKLEMPVSWQGFCERAIHRGTPGVAPILSEVCGYRRIPLGHAIARSLPAIPDHPYANAVWALSRLPGSAVTVDALKGSLGSRSAAVRSAAVLGLLWKSSSLAVQACQRWALDEEWPCVSLALAGNRSALAALRERLATGRGTASSLRAAGLLGDLSTVRMLCEYLGDHELAECAAWALYWIVGAPLQENAFIEEVIQESELFDAERRALRERGEKPRRGDGTPFGRHVRRLSHDRHDWEQWLNRNQARFDPGPRYRHGALHSPTAVIRGLRETRAPHAMRQLAYEELSIRFACPVTFEADWPVEHQVAALQRMIAWAGSHAPPSAAGAWY